MTCDHRSRSRFHPTRMCLVYTSHAKARSLPPTPITFIKLPYRNSVPPPPTPDVTRCSASRLRLRRGHTRRQTAAADGFTPPRPALLPLLPDAFPPPRPVLPRPPLGIGQYMIAGRCTQHRCTQHRCALHICAPTKLGSQFKIEHCIAHEGRSDLSALAFARTVVEQ